MTTSDHVFELDTDALLADVFAALERSGFHITEQVPEGVWWIRSDAGREATAERMLAVFRERLTATLAEIQQDGQ